MSFVEQAAYFPGNGPGLVRSGVLRRRGAREGYETTLIPNREWREKDSIDEREPGRRGAYPNCHCQHDRQRERWPVAYLAQRKPNVGERHQMRGGRGGSKS